MKFYVVASPAGERLGCETSMKAVEQLAWSYGYTVDDVEVTPMHVEVSAENIRRLLGGLGGYANPAAEL